MDPEVQAQFDEIRAILRDGAVRANEMEMRFNRRMDRAEQRMDRAEQRMDRAEQRMEKFEQQLQATRKLVEAGLKIVSRLATDTRELKRAQKAFLDSLRNGRNGRKHAG